jgi:hypothetical protein
LLLIPWLAATTVAAQPAPPADKPPADKPPADKPPADKPPAAAERKPPMTLEARLKALEVDLADVQSQNEDLRSEVADLKAKQAASKPPLSPSALNPQITAFLNGAVRIDDRPVLTPSGAAIDDRPFLRTAEVDFRAAVDPYADAVVILAFEDEAGQGFAADLEEGYVLLKRLPFFESAPLGLKLKLGRFRPALGNFNRLHMHDLPWTTRPLPISRFLGSENGEFFEAGFNPVGIDADMILPSPSDVVLELNLDVLDSGNIAFSGTGDGGGRAYPAFLGRLNLFFTARDVHDFNIGVSAYGEPGDHRAGLLSFDMLYKWKPLAAGEFRSFVLGCEGFYGDRRFALDSDGDGLPDQEHRTTPFAWDGFAQLQLSWHVYAGARFDYVQDIGDENLSTYVAAGYLSYYTSEFLRFRLGYEHRWSDLPADDGIDSVLAEVNVVFGSHPTEPYWVNR